MEKHAEVLEAHARQLVAPQHQGSEGGEDSKRSRVSADSPAKVCKQSGSGVLQAQVGYELQAAGRLHDVSGAMERKAGQDWKATRGLAIGLRPASGDIGLGLSAEAQSAWSRTDKQRGNACRDAHVSRLHADESAVRLMTGRRGNEPSPAIIQMLTLTHFI